MTTLHEIKETTYTWRQIESAMLAIDLKRFTAAARVGETMEQGAIIARADICHDLRVKLEELEAEQERRLFESVTRRSSF